MIFSNKRTILSINREIISYAKGNLISGKIDSEIIRKPWSEENLHVAVLDIAKNFPRLVRVVVGEDFSYNVSFKKAKKETDVSEQAQALIPENLKEGWDFSQKNPTDTVQVMAVQKKLFSLIQKLFSEAALKAEVVETESVSASRMVPKSKKVTALFARYDSVVLVGALNKGTVLTTEIFDEFPTPEQIKEFVRYLSERFDIKFEKVYVQAGAEELERVFQEVGLEIEQVILDPMVGICKKRHLRGKDSEILNIDLEKIKPEKNKKVAPASGEKILLWVFVSLFILCTVFVALFLRSRKNVSKTGSAAVQVLKK